MYDANLEFWEFWEVWVGEGVQNKKPIRYYNIFFNNTLICFLVKYNRLIFISLENSLFFILTGISTKYKSDGYFWTLLSCEWLVILLKSFSIHILNYVICQNISHLLLSRATIKGLITWLAKVQPGWRAEILLQLYDQFQPGLCSTKTFSPSWRPSCFIENMSNTAHTCVHFSAQSGLRRLERVFSCACKTSTRHALTHMSADFSIKK